MNLMQQSVLGDRFVGLACARGGGGGSGLGGREETRGSAEEDGRETRGSTGEGGGEAEGEVVSECYLSRTGYWGGGMHAVYSMSRAEDKLVAIR